LVAQQSKTQRGQLWMCPNDLSPKWTKMPPMNDEYTDKKSGGVRSSPSLQKRPAPGARKRRGNSQVENNPPQSSATTTGTVNIEKFRNKGAHTNFPITQTKGGKKKKRWGRKIRARQTQRLGGRTTFHFTDSLEVAGQYFLGVFGRETLRNTNCPSSSCGNKGRQARKRTPGQEAI